MTAFRKERLQGLSCLKGNFHEQFLGGWAGAIPPGYPALGRRTARQRALILPTGKGGWERRGGLAKQAVHKAWSHVDYWARLLEGEADLRRDRATKSRMRLARFPVITT